MAFKDWNRSNRGANPRSNRTFAVNKRKAARQRGFASRRGTMMYTKVLRSVGRKGEIKAVDTSNGNANVNLQINTTGNVTAMNLVSAGSSFFNRIGRKIEMKSVHFHGNLIFTANAPTQEDYLRVIIVYDRQTNGAVPAVTDILQNTDQQGANTNNAYADVNLNNRERFMIIMDKRISAPAVTAVGLLGGIQDSAQPVYANINHFKKLGGLLTHFKADSSPAVIGDVATGGLFLLTLGTVAAGSNGYSLNASWRVRYDDT